MIWKGGCYSVLEPGKPAYFLCKKPNLRIIIITNERRHDFYLPSMK